MSRIVSLTPTSVVADSRTWKEAASFARLGHESIVVEGRSSDGAADEAPFAVHTVMTLGDRIADTGDGGEDGGTRSTIEGVTGVLHRALGPVYWLASYAVFNLATVRRLPPADIYWLHGFEQFPAVLARRTPYVYDAHDVYAALPFDGSALTVGDRLIARLRRAIERSCVRHAAALVTTSESMARLFVEGAGGRWTVVRNLQDGRLDEPAERDLRALCGLDAEAFLLVLVGNHKPGTAVSEAVQAVASLPDRVHLALVGVGWEEVVATNPHPRVHTPGPVAPTQIRDVIATADACALIYVYATENTATQLPNGFSHAAHAGLPVLYPVSQPEVAALCERYAMGLPIDPSDPASLGGAVLRLLDEDGLLAGLRAGARRAGDELSWEREERTLESVVLGVLAGTQSSASTARQ